MNQHSGPEMVHRSCPICNSGDDSTIFAQASYSFDELDAYAFASRKLPEYMRYRLILCKKCDLAYANPAPTHETLVDGYEHAAFGSAVEESFASKTYGKLVAECSPRLPSLHGAVDIGTGNGSFLRELLTLKFDGVSGIEPSLAPIESASPEIKPLIIHSVFNAASMKSDSCSLVTCFQTIEHVENPLDLVRGTREILRDGGVALFVCHNRNALVNRILSKRSPIFDIEHVQLFSKQSARELFLRAGFSQVKVTSIVNRYPLYYWLQLFPFPRRLKSKLIARFKVSKLGSIPVSLPVGNIVVSGTKPNLVSES